MGVQWHPEELSNTDQMSANLVYNFVRSAASDWRNEASREWGATFAAVCMAQPASGNGTVGNGTVGNGATDLNGARGEFTPAVDGEQRLTLRSAGATAASKSDLV